LNNEKVTDKVSFTTIDSDKTLKEFEVNPELISNAFGASKICYKQYPGMELNEKLIPTGSSIEKN